MLSDVITSQTDNAGKSRALQVVFLFTLFISSCGWVDSTGRNNADDQTSDLFSGFAAVGSNNNSPTNSSVDLATTRIVQVFERNTIRVTPSIGDASTSQYLWQSTSSGMDDSICQRVGVFDSDLAVDTLQQACVDQNSCELSFLESNNARDESVFDIAVPQLRAPISLGFELIATQSNGTTLSEAFTMCAVSINDAPSANNDNFAVVRGQSLSVNGNDIINLLSNDVDDQDVANQPLRVLPDLLESPTLASNFQLRTDGGFTYTAPNTIAGATTDRFIYQVTDGTATDQATVTIRIINSNRPPALISDLPDLTLIAGQALNPDDTSLDLSVFFSDPDFDSLIFQVTPDSLPTSNNLSVTNNGRIVGRVTAEDVGNYVVRIGATDGNTTASGTFTLTVLPVSALTNNSAPVIQPIESLVVAEGNRANFQISATDPDGDRLQFALSDDSPDFLSINRNTGRLRVAANAPGLFRATVIVSDGVADSSTFFFIRIASENNQPPQVDDISNIVVSGSFNYDVSVFFEDPDGDMITFTAVNLPPGLNISPAGVISGTPAPNNLGPHFIVVTADDGNLGMASDGFLLRIVQ